MKKKNSGKKDSWDLTHQPRLSTHYFTTTVFISLSEEVMSTATYKLASFENNPGELKKLVYKENVTKTYAGGLKHRRMEPNVKEHYENIDCPEKCHVRIFEKYLSMRPPDSNAAFYLKPLQATNTSKWGFSGKMVLGINTKLYIKKYAEEYV